MLCLVNGFFFFSFFFEAVFKEVGPVHCKSRTAWHAAQLSAMRVCRESWACSAVGCGGFWLKQSQDLVWASTKLKGSLPGPPPFFCTALSEDCLRRSPLLRLISIVIFFVCRASLDLKLLWCRWWLRAEFWRKCCRWGRLFMPGLMQPWPLCLALLLWIAALLMWQFFVVFFCRRLTSVQSWPPSNALCCSVMVQPSLL